MNSLLWWHEEKEKQRRWEDTVWIHGSYPFHIYIKNNNNSNTAQISKIPLLSSKENKNFFIFRRHKNMSINTSTFKKYVQNMGAF